MNFFWKWKETPKTPEQEIVLKLAKAFLNKDDKWFNSIILENINLLAKNPGIIKSMNIEPVIASSIYWKVRTKIDEYQEWKEKTKEHLNKWKEDLSSTLERTKILTELLQENNKLKEKEFNLEQENKVLKQEKINLERQLKTSENLANKYGEIVKELYKEWLIKEWDILKDEKIVLKKIIELIKLSKSSKHIFKWLEKIWIIKKDQNWNYKISPAIKSSIEDFKKKEKNIIKTKENNINKEENKNNLIKDPKNHKIEKYNPPRFDTTEKIDITKLDWKITRKDNIDIFEEEKQLLREENLKLKEEKANYLKEISRLKKKLEETEQKLEENSKKKKHKKHKKYKETKEIEEKIWKKIDTKA